MFIKDIYIDSSMELHNLSGAVGNKEDCMEPGLFLELILRELGKTGDDSIMYGSATALENLIGKENCKKLHDYIKERIKEKERS